MKLLDLIISKFKKNDAYVGVFVSPRSYIEVVKFDVETNSISKHDKLELSYDPLTRKINDIREFETNIVRLYDILGIPLNTPAVLSIPTMFLGHASLPMQLDDSEIKSVLTDQLENNFLFRNQEPEISYECITTIQDSNTMHLAFTAIPKMQISEILQVLKRQDVNVVAIDTSYAALLRGLSIAGVCDSDIEEGSSWLVLLINNNSLVLLCLIGSRLIDYVEIPVAIKSFQSSEVCSVIVSYTGDNINSQSPDHLIIISKSDDVSAVEVAENFNLNCKVTTIDENIYNKEPLFNSKNLEQELVNLETVGAAFWKKSDIPVSFNFLGSNGPTDNSPGKEIKIGSTSFYLTAKLLQNILLGSIVCSLLLVVAIYLACSAIISSMEKTSADLSAQKSQLESAINSSNAGNQTNTNDIISKVFTKNGKFLQSFNALGSVIPEKVWIESFEMKDDFNATIKGKAYSVDDIVIYYQNLVKSAYFQNLKISSIRVVGDDSTGGNNGVSIIPKSENQITPPISNAPPSLGALPGMPSLPSVSSQRYYEFSFGNSSSSTLSSSSSIAPPQPSLMGFGR